MAINYKILCEVKFLHEYYLTNKDGSTIFDKPLQTDRLTFLRERFKFNYPSVNEHLSYEPPLALKAMFGNFKLRVINSYSGFKLFVSVKEQMLPGDIKAYKPSLSLADDLPVLIQLRYKDFSLDTLSNSSAARSLPAKYYFTNRNLGTPQLSPCLSSSPPLRDDTLPYEQGELALDGGDNLVKAFFFEKSGAKNWLPVNAAGYVNTNDLSLLPVRFEYSFSSADAVTDATFVLKDSANAPISTINRTGTDPLKKIMLDYSELITTTLNTADTTIPALHSLQVTGSNGYNKTHPIIFCEPSLMKDSWGLIHLQPRVTDPLFNLLDNDGLLVTRKNPDGSIVPPPVFEIRIKSRFAFWRYLNNRNEKILDNPALHPYLLYDAAAGSLETKKMVNISYTPIEFSNMGATQYLPNPDIMNPLKNELRRVYTDIRVPESDLFKI